MMKTLLFAVLALAVLSLMFEAVTANNWEQETLGEGDSGRVPYQGDIVLTTDQELELLASTVSENDPFPPQYAVLARSSSLWPGGVVPYVINSNLGQTARDGISRAMEQYTAQTCIRFVPRTSQHADYVEFYRGGGCSSSIGRVRGRQFISIGRGCEGVGTVIHEIFHALGRWHEQGRPDRDQFVEIVLDNIRPGLENQFDKVSTRFATTQGISYDYRSVMHYSSTAFSRNGRATILPRNNAVDPRQLGNRRGFTSRDIQHVNTLYRCAGTGGTAGSWSQWGAWSACSRSCNGGLRSRTRSCNGGTGCQGPNTQEERCNTQTCPVAASWGQWGRWSGCSRSCGGGQRVRVRSCLNGNNCVGSSRQSISCNTEACPTSGVWSAWSTWSACSQTCQGGTQRRARVCVDRTRRQITDDCMGEGEELRSCNNGISCSGSTTSQWSVWTKCSRECGGGRRSRSRGCDNSFCEVVEEDCNTQPCSPEPALEGLTYVGCFYLVRRYAYNLLSLEGATEDLTDDYQTRTQPVRKCGQAAREYNYTTFSLVNGYCISGSNNTDAYTVFGASDNCQNGTGDIRTVTAYSRRYGYYRVQLYSMDVYRISNPVSFDTSALSNPEDERTSAASVSLKTSTLSTILTLVLVLLFQTVFFML